MGFSIAWVSCKPSSERLLSLQTILHDETYEIVSKCCYGLMNMPKCCEESTCLAHLVCTSHRFIYAETVTQDRCCILCCALPAPTVAHRSVLLVNQVRPRRRR